MNLRQLWAARNAAPPNVPCPVKAVSWLRNHESTTGGMLAYSGASAGDPAITGALLPTLTRNGERELAERCVTWLHGIQQPDGCYPSTPTQSTTFVTSEVLSGLLSVPELKPAGMKS